MNETLLVVGYGSLLSGHGLLTIRRQGKSALTAREAFPVVLGNARRGLAKLSSHGHYLAMDLEPCRRDRPIVGRLGRNAHAGEFGAIGLVFDRALAADIARREEYDPGKMLQLLELADQAGRALGEFLLEIARDHGFDPLRYRQALARMLDYTSPGYIFHPLPLADGRVALVAIGSGFEGSGDPRVISKRSECGIDRLMTLPEALELKRLGIERAGQLGYFIECLLGGAHGLWVGDLIDQWFTEQAAPALKTELTRLLGEAMGAEHKHFLSATALSPTLYRARFGTPGESGLHPAMLGRVAA